MLPVCYSYNLPRSIKMLRYLPSLLKFRTRIAPVQKNLVSFYNSRNSFLFAPQQIKELKILNTNHEQREKFSWVYGIWAVSILTWLGFSSDDENKESELIMTLKRAVLCTKREQYNKAEQLLHIALRIAQDQQNEDAIVYCFDLMANLAFEQQNLDKAEKLFVTVLQILLGKGMKQDDLKTIHISLKLARICQLRAEEEKAILGYEWCLEKINSQKEDSLDSQILYGVIHDWYAQLLLDKGNISKALIHLEEAYKSCRETIGAHDEKSMLLLNDLGITSFRAGDIESAKVYLKEGIGIGNKVDDQTHMGVLHANLGLVLLHQGIVKEAEKYCKEAWHLGKKNQNDETVEQANYCFDQIKIKLEK